MKITYLFHIIALPLMVFGLTGCFLDAEDMVLDVDVPERVMSGEEFDIVINIKNMSNTDKEIDSIAIGDAYLDGIEIVSTEPEYGSELEYGFDDGVLYEFFTPISGQSTETFVFHARAGESGEYFDEVGVFVDGIVKSVFSSAHTVVESGETVSEEGEEEEVVE